MSLLTATETERRALRASDAARLLVEAIGDPESAAMLLKMLDAGTIRSISSAEEYGYANPAAPKAIRHLRKAIVVAGVGSKEVRRKPRRFRTPQG